MIHKKIAIYRDFWHHDLAVKYGLLENPPFRVDFPRNSHLDPFSRLLTMIFPWFPPCLSDFPTFYRDFPAMWQMFPCGLPAMHRMAGFGPALIGWPEISSVPYQKIGRSQFRRVHVICCLFIIGFFYLLVVSCSCLFVYFFWFLVYNGYCNTTKGQKATRFISILLLKCLGRHPQPAESCSKK